jgi:hypothetical protein
MKMKYILPFFLFNNIYQCRIMQVLAKDRRLIIQTDWIDSPNKLADNFQFEYI